MRADVAHSHPHNKAAKLLRCSLAAFCVMLPYVAMADTLPSISTVTPDHPLSAGSFEGDRQRAWRAQLDNMYSPQQTWWQKTQLVQVTQGSSLSQKAADARKVQYESSTGEAISMEKWYSTSWVDMDMLFMTPVTTTSAVLWGVSTGERAEKYTIDPSLTLGWAQIWTPARRHTIAFNVKATIGGKLKEKTCTADYSDIGGIQQVNCRLAATTLSPEETLNYLLNSRPTRRVQASLRWTYLF